MDVRKSGQKSSPTVLARHLIIVRGVTTVHRQTKGTCIEADPELRPLVPRSTDETVDGTEELHGNADRLDRRRAAACEGCEIDGSSPGVAREEMQENFEPQRLAEPARAVRAGHCS